MCFNFLRSRRSLPWKVIRGKSGEVVLKVCRKDSRRRSPRRGVVRGLGKYQMTRGSHWEM